MTADDTHCLHRGAKTPPVPQRWLFSPATDLAAFAGTALLSFAFATLAPSLGIPTDTPPWVWLLFVVFIDVAHVWATLFRTYLDGEELQRRPLLYAGAPLFAFAAGVILHAISDALFWRALAYVAAWHFIRQQVGWMVLYGRRAKSSEREITFDRLAILAATLGPVVWWHANLPRTFWWFRENDFISGLPASVGTIALIIHALVLISWLAHAVLTRTFHPGKTLLLFATWLAWFGGIVLARSDLTFTVMNVALHGVPYFILLRRYQRSRVEESGYGRLNKLLRYGLPVFLLLLLTLAFLEELVWDQLVWHEHPMFFGAGGFDLPATLMTLIVPLLSLPQTTHYVLDGFIWKTRNDPHLTARLGWHR